MSRVRHIGEAPHASDMMRRRDAEDSTVPDESAGHINTFMVADVRGLDAGEAVPVESGFRGGP